MTDELANAVDYPLFVVTACAQGEVSGCVAGFVTQSSITPVRFLVCVSKVNHTFGVAERGGHLGLHLLGSGQGALASLFGEESGDTVDKFAQVSWSSGVTGVPILASCAAWLEGPIIDQHSAGDHEAYLVAARAGGLGSETGQFMSRQAAGFEPGHPA
jgi:flavin reductase (DIM6/NTAB) family NADH-FMN oxidoreductase RutF